MENQTAVEILVAVNGVFIRLLHPRRPFRLKETSVGTTLTIKAKLLRKQTKHNIRSKSIKREMLESVSGLQEEQVLEHNPNRFSMY